MNKKTKTFLVHLPAGFSLFCSGLWFLPWIIEPRVALSYYLLAFSWFLVAWILMLWLLVLGFREKRRGTGEAGHFFVGSALMGASYLIVLVGATKGFLVTV